MIGRSGGPRRALAGGALGLLLAIPACDRRPEPEGIQRVDVRERDPRIPRSGPTPEVVERLRAPDDAQRIVYDRPLDLRRRPGAAEWPPVAANWPGAGEDEPAGAIRRDEPAGGAGQPMGEPPDTTGGASADTAADTASDAAADAAADTAGAGAGNAAGAGARR